LGNNNRLGAILSEIWTTWKSISKTKSCGYRTKGLETKDKEDPHQNITVQTLIVGDVVRGSKTTQTRKKSLVAYINTLYEACTLAYKLYPYAQIILLLGTLLHAPHKARRNSLTRVCFQKFSVFTLSALAE
jgi:hypothetical protein